MNIPPNERRSDWQHLDKYLGLPAKPQNVLLISNAPLETLTSGLKAIGNTGPGQIVFFKSKDKKGNVCSAKIPRDLPQIEKAIIAHKIGFVMFDGLPEMMPPGLDPFSERAEQLVYSRLKKIAERNKVGILADRDMPPGLSKTEQVALINKSGNPSLLVTGQNSQNDQQMQLTKIENGFTSKESLPFELSPSELDPKIQKVRWKEPVETDFKP